MNKGLEALEKIKKLYKAYIDKIGLGINDIMGFDFSIMEIEKELKEGEKNKQALEIIKIFLDKMGISFRFERDLIICIFINNKFDGTFTCDTQEEYDLLKEVML